MGANARLRLTDTTFRDGHQSSLATRLRLDDMLSVAAELDRMGFHSAEVWGGATFDVATRYLNEDPWERPRLLKEAMPNTPLQMLLRGQNLVGYRNYADDVVRAFVHQAAGVGIDIFRVFDALNDERNFEAAFAAIKECGKHIQATISYSLTERHLGGPVFTLDYFVQKALRLQDMGGDSLCIKDMAGILSPADAYELVRALKRVLRIPIQLHTHYTSGMGSMTYLKAVEAGVDIVDTALAPFALRSSQPAVEPLLVALEGSDRDPGMDLAAVIRLGERLEAIAPKYRDFLDTTRMSIIDTNVLQHQIPGGMISNFVAQLREAGALERLGEVLAELPRTRADLGYPPLVTPTSQIVGIQAVQNVLFGRYQMVSSQVKDYAYGLYGQPPRPMDPEVQRQVLRGYERGEEPITCRPADVLEPEMDKARAATKGLARDERDVLVYALFPTTGLRFLRWKYGLEEAPPDTRPKTLEDVRREDELLAKAKTGQLAEKSPAPARGPGWRTFSIFVDGQQYQVEVEPTGPRPASVAAGAAPAATPTAVRATPARAAAPPAVQVVAEGTAIRAPMPGMVVRYEVDEGQQVKAGQVVVILEAMKMENALTSPFSGTVKQVTSAPGTKVGKDEVLAVVG